MFSRGQTHLKEPVFFSEKVLKLTYCNVEIKHLSGGNTPGSSILVRGRGEREETREVWERREEVGWRE